MSWISPRLVPCRQGSVGRAGAYRLEHYNIELLARSRSSSPSDRSGDRPGQTSQAGWRLWRAQRLRRAASQAPSREGVCWGEAVRRTPFDSSSTVRLTRRVHEVTLGAAPHRRRHLHRRAKRGVSEILRGEVMVRVQTGASLQAGAPSSAATPTNSTVLSRLRVLLSSHSFRNVSNLKLP